MTLNEFLFGFWIPTLFGVCVGVWFSQIGLPWLLDRHDAWSTRRDIRRYLREYRGER